MSIITMATTKGGAGKTTIAQMITGEVHRQGYSVGVIDADPNGTLSSWLDAAPSMAIEHKQILDETKIVSEAKKLARKHDLVIIDTAGALSQTTIFAIGCADLVLVPVQLSQGDVDEAKKTFKLARSASQLADREIPVRVVYTGYTPKTKLAKRVRKDVSDRGMEAMKTRLHHLVAYKELTFSGKVPKKGTAAAQGQLLVQEIADMGCLQFIRDFKRAS
jgi:chromosome partitioning protein